MSKIFICYRRDDSEGYVGRLYDRLRERFNVFMDTADISAGEDFSAKIRGVIRASTAMLVVIGPRWLTLEAEPGKPRLRAPKDHVRLEIVEGFRNNLKIIPVLVQGAQMPTADDLPRGTVPLSRLNAVEIRHSTFDQDFQKLIEHLARVESDSDAPSAEPTLLPASETAAAEALSPTGSALTGWQRAKNLAYLIFFGAPRKPRPEEKTRDQS